MYWVEYRGYDRDGCGRWAIVYNRKFTGMEFRDAKAAFKYVEAKNG